MSERIPDLPPLVPGAELRVGDGPVLRVAVARAAEELERGLMFRDALGDVDGMLFVLASRGLHGFWMQDVRMPLDLAWMDARWTVVDVAAGVPPCSAPPCPVYVPRRPARYVLEVRAGVLAAIGARPGTTIAVRWL